MTPRLQISCSWQTWLAAVGVALALSGCGGGGDGGASTPAGSATPPASVVILDSFGQVVAAGGSDGVGGGDSGADGTAGEGAAIVGGRVQVTDTNGKTVAATTDAQGYYRVKVTGFAPPFVVTVTKVDGKILRSLNVAPLKVNGFVTVNISGLTDKVASDVAVAGGKKGAADLTPQIVAANTSAITASINNLRTQLSSVITAAGLAVASFDPIGVPFRPDHKSYDLVLESVKVVVAADGSTQVTVTPTVASYAGRYTGTYSGGSSNSIDSGSFDAVIGTDGTLSGTGSSTKGFTFTLSGRVCACGDVSFGAVSSTGGAATFQGSISPSGALTGTWSSPPDSGTFSGQRR